MSASRRNRDTSDHEEIDYPDEIPQDRKEGRAHRHRVRSFFISAVIHLAFVLGIIAILILSLWIYTGSWPPVMVVESGSMMHHEKDSRLGVIDTGDLILLKSLDENDMDDGITTWVDRKEEHYGSWGDVIIYRRNGERTSTPLVHRVVLWLEVNNTNYDPLLFEGATYDIPSMGVYAESKVATVTGYPSFAMSTSETFDLKIDVKAILNEFRRRDEKPKSGYITKGDNNPTVDQPGLSLPVEPEWIMGEAKGEIPWYGLINLMFRNSPDPIPFNSWVWFFVTLGLVLSFAFIIEFGFKAKKDKREGKGQDRKKGTGERDDGSGRKKDYPDFGRRYFNQKRDKRNGNEYRGGPKRYKEERKRRRWKRGRRDHCGDHEGYEDYGDEMDESDEWDDEFFNEYDGARDYQSGRERYREKE